MAYGTPRPATRSSRTTPTSAAAGRRPPEALADLVARYEAIGGISPLAELTEAQRDALQAALDEIAPDRYHVTLGLKHADPKVEAAQSTNSLTLVFGRSSDSCSRPHYSSYSIGQYLGRARRGVEPPRGIDTGRRRRESGRPSPRSSISSPTTCGDGSPRCHARRATTAGACCSPPTRSPNASSTPATPTPTSSARPPRRSPAELGLTEGDDWQIAWQSAGRTPEPWIGPDILDVIDELGADRRAVDGVIVSSVGFVADHLEVLYDLDIEAAHRADDVGLRFDRTACVNDDADVMRRSPRAYHAAAGG